MKKLNLLFIGVFSMSNVMAQDITDAVRYSMDEVQGTARFVGMSGAFGALGGDMSAVSINPAGSAIFSDSHTSFSLSNLNINNDVTYFNGFNSSSESKFDLNQAGAAFVFKNNNQDNKWKKFVLSVAYDKTSNFENNWVASGTNSNFGTIGNYFLNYAQGLRLDEISALPGENFADAYSEIGNIYGFGHQQAFLGYESYILEPDANTDENTGYSSNIVGNNFNQRYAYVSTGFNGKFAFNFASQYGDNLFFGLNLNSHFLNYERATFFNESNSNAESLVSNVYFENYLATIGSGFSFQLGTIAKLTDEFRVGITYNSPTWYTIAEETSQYLSATRDDGISNVTQVINPNIINIFPEYRLQTPGKLTGSLAYVFSELGLISFDYTRKDYGNTKFKPTSDAYFTSQNNIINDNLKVASSYRIGGEYRYKQLSFRGGYRLEESPYENEEYYGDLNGYSLGLGYNFGNIKLDLALDRSNRTGDYQLYTVGLTDAATMDSKNTNVTLTLGFNL